MNLRRILLMMMIAAEAAAQPFTSTFKKTYDRNGLWQTAICAAQNPDSTYLLFCKQVGFSYDDNMLIVYRLSSHGDTLSSTSVQRDSTRLYFINSLSAVHIGNSIYISGSTKNAVNNSFEALLLKFNHQGDTVLTRTYPGTGMYNSFRHQCRSHDSMLVFAGFTKSTDPSGNIWIVKTDTSGNLLWEKQFGGAGYQEGFYIDRTTDHGFVICGWEGSWTNADSWIMKIDSAGNFVWKTYLGGSGNNAGSGVPVSLPNGETFIAMGNEKPDGFAEGYIARINSSGGIVWERHLPNSTYYLFNTYGNALPLLNADMSVIVMGFRQLENLATGETAVHTTFSKMDSSGNLLWERIYNAGVWNGIADNGYGLLKSLDDGICYWGFTNNPTQDAWFGKLDSAGCDSSGCPTIISSAAEEIKSAEAEFTFYPNPFLDFANLKIKHAQGERTLNIYNRLGCLISTLTLRKNENEITIGQELPAGIYFFKVLESGGKGKAAGKFAKLN